MGFILFKIQMAGEWGDSEGLLGPTLHLQKRTSKTCGVPCFQLQHGPFLILSLWVQPMSTN